MRFTAIHSVEDRKKNRGGFTLIELMIALLIMGVLLTAIYRVFISQEGMFRTQEQVAGMQENLRATTEFLNQEMSWLGYGVPNLAIRYAGTTQIIYKANLPNTGGTDSFVRYTFDATNERIMRAVETTLAAVQNDNNLKILANDVDSLTFSYFDGFGAQLTQISPLNPAVSPTNDNALATIRRIRSTIVVKSSRPDLNYTNPTKGDNFRRRSAVVDIKTRNVEDVTVASGGVGTGSCSSFTMDVAYPGASGEYSSCSDQQDELATGTQTLTDNPLLTVTVVDPDGNPDNNTPVSISADYDYIFADSGGTERSVITGRSNGAGSVYLGASPTAVTAEGTQVTVSAYFTPPEAGCLQLSHTETLTVTSGTPSRFDTLAPYDINVLDLEYVLLDTGTNISPQPSSLSLCSAASNVGAKLKVRVEDDCDNGIEGETVDYSIDPTGKGTFQTGTQDNGDGTYSVVYIPPDTITTGAASETVDIAAQWSTSSNTRTLTLTPGSAYDMVINSIEGPKDGGGSYLYQFASPTSNSFNMERVSNQHVLINFSVVDACGNRVFGQESNLTITPSYGAATAVVAEADGTYTFDWYSPLGCGPAISDQNMVITDSGITTALGTETIEFNLFASLEPILNLSVTKGTSPFGLTAGCTSDEVDVSAVLQEYDPVVDECVNIVRPEGSVTDSYPVTFTVTGSSPILGNGSFNHTDLTQDTTTTSTDAFGYAYAALNPGSAMKDQILTVAADADVDGQIYPQTASVQVPMLVSEPKAGSGFYNSSYSAKKGENEAVRHYDPGDGIFVQVGDCDENEHVFQVDAISPPPVSVTLQSELTGDVENFEIRETGANSAVFRFAPGIMTELNTVATPGDSKLQVDYGDRVTMKYVDNDDPAPATEYTWDVFISGPRWLKLYKDNGDGTESPILSGGTQILNMYNNDRMRPKVYIPRFESDSSISTELVTALDSSGSGGETETVTLREFLDTGVFIPDIIAYGQDNVLLSESGSIPLANELYLPYTPKTITVSYPAGSPIDTASFLIEDGDLPEVSITAPADGSSVSGAVDIDVYAEDTNNTINPAITQVDLYIDTYLVKTWTGTDLTGTNTYSWVTESGGVPYWLNGTHTLYARARDGAGNWNTSASISVIVTNPGNTIWFTAPANNSVWNSTTVDVGLQTAVFDTNNPSYSVALKIGTTYRTLADLGGDAYAYSWDTSLEGTGQKTMIATVQDSQGNTDSATWSAIVDHTAPVVSPTSTSGEWVSSFNYWGYFEVSDASGFADSSNTVLVSVNGTGGFIDQPAQFGGSTWDPVNQVNVASYSFSWAGPGSAVEDTSYTWSVKAYDSSLPSPGNLGTGSLAFYVDNIDPTVDAPVVSSSYGSVNPAYGPFVKGTVTLSSRVNDSFAGSGFIYFISKDNPLGTVSTTFNVATNPAMAFTWETDGLIPTTTTPWPGGAYAIYIKGRDLAYNENINAMTQSYHFYVDNGVPTIASSTPGSGFATSVVSVPYSADSIIGFLASTGYSVFDSSASAVFSSTRNFSLASAVATTTASFTVDTRSAPTNGPHSIKARVSDHAENSFSTAEIPFEICNRVATLGTVVWDKPIPSRYRVQFDGTLFQLSSTGTATPVTGNMAITVTNLENSQSYSDSVTTSAPGNFSYVHTFQPSEISLGTGNSVRLDVENTDSGCHTNFTIDDDSNTQTLP